MCTDVSYTTIEFRQKDDMRIFFKIFKQLNIFYKYNVVHEEAKTFFWISFFQKLNTYGIV